MMKWQRYGLILMGVFLSFCFFLAFFIYTSFGLRTITYVVRKTVPEVHIDYVEGTLYDFKMRKFSFNTAGVAVEIDNLAFSLSGLCFFHGAACVKSFSAENVVVNVETDALPKYKAKEQGKDNTPFFLKTPIAIELKDALLEKVNVRVNDMRFGLDKFHGKATWIRDYIRIYPSSATGVKAIFSDNRALQEKITNDIPLQEKLQDLLSNPIIKRLPNVHIPIKIAIMKLTGSNWLLHLGGDYYFNNLTIKGNIDDSDIRATRIVSDVNTPYQNMHVILEGSAKLADNWPIDVGMKAKTQSDDDIQTLITSHTAGNLLGALKMQIEISGKNNFNLTGSFNSIENLPLTIQITGKHIQWPLSGTAKYQLNNFTLSASGLIRQLTLFSQGEFSGYRLPGAKIKLKAESQHNSFNLNQLALVFDQGNVEFKGNISWLNDVHWRAEANINYVNLPSQIPDWPINLNGRMVFSGKVHNKQWIANMSNIGVVGRMRDMPFETKGNLSANSDFKLNADNFKLHWGKNRLILDGNMYDNKTLNANIDFAELQLFSRNIDGKAKGFFAVSGSLFKPTSETDIKFTSLAINQIVAEQIHLQAKTHYSNKLSGNVRIEALSFVYGETIALEKVRLTLKGDEQNHAINISMKGNPLGSNIKLHGHFTNNRTRWLAKMQDSVLTIGKKNWRLNHPVALSYDFSQPKARVQAHCWTNQDAKLCLVKDMVLAGKGSLILKLNNVDMAMLDLFLGDEIQLLGGLSGEVAIFWQNGEVFPHIAANVYSNHVFMNQRIGQKILTIPFDVFRLNLQLDNQKAKLDWRLSLKEYGDLSGLIEVQDPGNKRKLRGQFSATDLSLSIFTPILQESDYTKGLINASLRFSGSLEKPMVDGKLALNQSDIKVSQLPADLQSLQISLDFYGQSSKLLGKIETRKGVIHIMGDADWHTINDWRANLTVKGDAVSIAKAPIQSMTIVPDIRMVATQDEFSLGGSVRIPKARIKVESLSDNIVSLSPDEVMLNNSLQEIKQKTFPMRINSNLLVIIEDNVQIDAFGLNASIKGQLLVKQNKQGLGLNGQILIPRGRFHAYGQDLIVRKGELIFSGLVNMPMLNIEAIRNPDFIENNVIAGIRVTGTADNPTVKLFSEPTMSEQETLSYILRGQGLENSDQNENNMMTAILIGLGTAQSGKYIGHVGELFGIRDLSLDTKVVGDNSQVVVSGYILPNLQLKYGVGIFDSLATFTLRYRLMPKLYLDVVSSLAQSVDLLYQFEI